MSPKSKPKWFRWLSPGTLFQNGKSNDFEVISGSGTDAETPLKSGTDIPQIVLMNPSKKQKSLKKERKMVTVSGPRCCQSIRRLGREITVEPVLFLYMLATFSQYASFQDLVFSRACLQSYPLETCDNLHSPKFLEEAEEVQRTASHLILISTTALVLPSVFIAIYLGSWSDRFGRKWPTVLPPFGGFLAMAFLIALAFQPELPIQWICAASFISGLFGGFVSCIMSCMSYVSANSSEKTRTVRISRLESMIFLGGTLGPFLSGALLQHIGHGLSFVFMMICYAVAFLYAVFFVEEVKDDEAKSCHQNNIDEHDQSHHVHRPQSAASTETTVSSSLKSSTLDSRHAHLDLDSSEQLLPLEHSLDIPDVSRPPNESVYVDTTTSFPYHDNDSNHHFDLPSPPSRSGSGASHHGEDGSSTAASDDEQRNILQRLPEPNDRPESCCSKFFGSEHLLSAIKTIIKKREDSRRLYIILVLAAGFLGMMITAGELDVAYLFAKGEPLKWTHKTFSYYFGLKYGLGTVGLLVGMPIFQHFHVRDSTICIVGLISRMAGLVLYALSPNTTVAFFVPVLAMFSIFSIPATRSLLSKLVSPDEQGKIFAGVAIMEDICTLTASMTFNSLYPLTRPILKGFIFLAAAALLLVPITIMWFIGQRLTRLEKLDAERKAGLSQIQPVCNS